MSGKKTRLYLAGPMTGYPLFNFPAFHGWSQRLREAGYDVVSPAEMDEAEGFEPANPLKLLTLDEYLVRDFSAIDQCDGVALMDGWEHSKGAQREVAYADSHNKTWHPVDVWAHLATFSKPATPPEHRVTDAKTGGEKCQKLARFDLVPPDANHALAEHYGKCGGDGKSPGKYADRNWERGYAYSLSLAAMERHKNAFERGEDVDPETGTLHTVAIAWHAHALTAFHLRGIGTDDRVFRDGKFVGQEAKP